MKHFEINLFAFREGETFWKVEALEPVTVPGNTLDEAMEYIISQKMTELGCRIGATGRK